MSDRQPILNVPAVVGAMAAIALAVHVGRLVMSEAVEQDLLLTFAFIPARFDPVISERFAFPGGVFGDAWVFVSHAFIHGEWAHLLINLAWLLVFGSPVAVRFGAVRFMVMFALSAAAGAALFLIANRHGLAPMVGMSGAIAGLTAASLRFAFQPGGPLSFAGRGQEEAYKQEALSLSALLANRQMLLFIGVWVGLNVLFGATSLLPGFGEIAVAWEAHLGGFLAGLLLFPLVDPVRAHS